VIDLDRVRMGLALRRARSAPLMLHPWRPRVLVEGRRLPSSRRPHPGRCQSRRQIV